MAPPLFDPLLLANMESVAFVLQLICIMHNKIKSSVVAVIDLPVLLWRMLHAQSTGTASWNVSCWWKSVFYLCYQWAMQFRFYQNDCNIKKEEICLMREHIKALCKLICILRLRVNANANQQHARNLPSVQAPQSIHSRQTTESRLSNGHQSGC